MPNILINSNSGILEFSTGIAGGSGFQNLSGASRISYDNRGGVTLTSYSTGFVGSGLDRFSVDGSNGRLFSVTDSLSGSLLSVNDIAGLPIFEVFDDNRVVMGKFQNNDFILTGSSVGIGGLPNTGTTKLYVSGNTILQGNLNISGSGNVVNLNGNQLVDFVPQFINETTNFIISGNDNGRIILANSNSQITGTIVSGNPTGFNTTIIQINSGIQITGSGVGVIIQSYNNQFKTAGLFATISLLHTGNNGYIMYGNTI